MRIVLSTSTTPSRVAVVFRAGYVKAHRTRCRPGLVVVAGRRFSFCCVWACPVWWLGETSLNRDRPGLAFVVGRPWSFALRSIVVFDGYVKVHRTRNRQGLVVNAGRQLSSPSCGFDECHRARHAEYGVRHLPGLRRLSLIPCSVWQSAAEPARRVGTPSRAAISSSLGRGICKIPVHQECRVTVQGEPQVGWSWSSAPLWRSLTKLCSFFKKSDQSPLYHHRVDKLAAFRTPGLGGGVLDPASKGKTLRYEPNFGGRQGTAMSMYSTEHRSWHCSFGKGLTR